MSSSTFSPDDMMNPIFCVQCRTQITKEASEQGEGLCANCLQSEQQRKTAALQQQQALMAQRAAEERAWQQERDARAQRGLSYAQVSWLIAVSILCALLVYHNVVVAPLEADLARTKADLASLTETSNHNAADLAGLTETVNHNAEAANHNAGLLR